MPAVDVDGREYYAAEVVIDDALDNKVVLVVGDTELLLDYEGVCRLTYELTEAITRKWRRLDD